MPRTGLAGSEGSRTRRSRAALVALACAAAMLAGALAAAPAGAAGPYIEGVSDQDLGLWSGNYQDASTDFNAPFPSFFGQSWVGDPPSHIQYARFVTAPDAVTQGGACEQNLYNWFTYVTQTLHLVPVIAVWDVAEGGCADNGAPSTADYTTDIGQLLAYLDGLGPAKVPYLEAWNEPNSSSISSAQAAAYWTAANAVCATDDCTAIAGDLVDNDPDQGSQSFEPGCAPGLTYTHLASYETAYVAALGAARPAIWGFHPYFAVNCEQSASVTTFEQNLPAPAGQVWFTEVGAWECVRGQPPRGPTQQNDDAEYLVNDLMSAADAPAQVFWYEIAPLVYTQSCSKYADSALYEGTQAPGFLYARPAAATVYGVDDALAAVTDGAGGESSGQATLNGTATPGGIYEGSSLFQYGTTNAYGFQTPSILLGPGLAPSAVSATVSGLTPGVAYHYRLVVTGTDGTQRDGDDELMTPPAVSSAPMAAAGSAVSVSWSGITEPASSDWVGLYPQGGSSALGGLYLDSCGAASSGAVPVERRVVRAEPAGGGGRALSAAPAQRTLVRAARDLGDARRPGAGGRTRDGGGRRQRDGVVERSLRTGAERLGGALRAGRLAGGRLLPRQLRRREHRRAARGVGVLLVRAAAGRRRLRAAPVLLGRAGVARHLGGAQRAGARGGTAAGSGRRRGHGLLERGDGGREHQLGRALPGRRRPGARRPLHRQLRRGELRARARRRARAP